MAVIREKTRVFNQPIGIVRTEAGAGDIGRAVSNVASRFQEIAFREAAEDAKKKGIEVAEAVEEKRLRTFNPETGKPEAFKAPKGFGRIAAAAYQSVIDKRYEDSINQELRIKAQEIAIKYPFDPQSYSDVMGNYIAEMSQGAKGKYKAYIDTMGPKFLALSELNIKKRVADRARQASANSILQGVNNGSNNAYDIAKAGGFIPRENEEVSEASSIAEREINNAKNGVSAALLKAGTDSEVEKQLNLSIALGGIEYILSKTDSPLQRNAIELAIRTNGENTGAVPSDLLDELTELLKYIDRSNINSVLTHSATVSSEYNTVQSDMKDALEIEMAQKARESEFQYGSTLTTFGSNSSNAASSGFNDESPMGVSAALGQIDLMYMKIESELNKRVQLDSKYTKNEYDADLSNARKEALRSLLIQAAAEGNVEEFRIALNTRNPEDMKNLTAKQIEFIHGIYKSKVFVPREDIGYAREVLSASKNDLRINAERERLRFEISQSVTEAGKLAETGGLGQKDFDNLVKEIKNNIGPNGLTSEQAESEINRLTKQRAFGFVETFARLGTSRDLNNLATYVDSNGKKTEGMSPDVIATGNLILGSTSTPEQKDAVVSKINGLKSTVASEELKADDALEKRNAHRRVMSGGGNVNDRDDRIYSQEILESSGINLGEFDSLDPNKKQAVISIMRSAAPQNFIDTMDQIAAGLPVKNAESYLNLFAILSNDPTGTGVFINRFGNAIDATTVELLNDINSIRTITGGNVNEIATTLIERRNDPKSNLQMNVVLSDKSPAEYVTEYTKDSIIGVELAASVEYMARTGKSKKQIDARIDTLIDQRYPKSTHIADPRFPANSIKRSRYALEAQFPEEEERLQFVAAVESQLPSGYALIPNLDAEDKKVYLVPDESTAGVRYFSYFIDENEELRPLIYDDNGTSVWPTFGRDDIANYYQQKELENADALIEAEAKQQAAFELQRQIKDIDPKVSAFTLGLGAGGL